MKIAITLLVLITFQLMSSSTTFAAEGCLYGMSVQEAKSLKRMNIDAYTLINDLSRCSDNSLQFLKDEYIKASKRSLRYLKARVDGGQGFVAGVYGEIGVHKKTKQEYELRLLKVQSALSLVLTEINKRSL